MMSRRTLALLVAAGSAAVFGAILGPSQAIAQAWPNKPITFIVPFAAGGGTDAFARPLAAQLEAQLGQRIVIDNRAGAGGTTGASAAAKAAPDGYTFFVGAAHHAIAPALYPRLDYNIETDLVPIGMVASPPQVIAVHPTKVAARTLAEFIADLKANPGKLNYGSAGNGTTHHLTGELFKLQTGTNIVHVPYRGAGPALADLVAGQIDVMFDGLGSSAGQIQGGALRGLAVAAAKRSPAIPDVPTTAEAGLPGFEVATWYALWAPKGTPPEATERMARELRTALASQPIKDAWARNGSDIPTLMGAEFAGFLKSEIARWGKVVSEAKVGL
ncbi:MAG: tripartite tricarboxylate transporter substrate binding protein [Beijerinckiaceae bacterium]|jgi:tripartite-type tricarboxylate transporter receptor subunit TctC|nr:tripartite tricarboxylate transporter substrate binding protein [Beijerinckiaceae bacterium]